MVTLVLATVVATFPGHAKSLECSPDDDSQSFWSKAQQVAQNKANAGLKLLEKGSDKAARRAKSIFEEVSVASGQQSFVSTFDSFFNLSAYS